MSTELYETEWLFAKKILLDKAKLEEENKQLKGEKPYLYTNTAWEDILEYQGKPYIELDRFKTIQQENKQLKESLDFLWNEFKKINTANRKTIEYITSSDFVYDELYKKRETIEKILGDKENE